MSDTRDSEIADLKAEVERLQGALDATLPDGDASDRPIFNHGLVGGAFGFVQVVIGMFALLILLKIAHHMAR